MSDLCWTCQKNDVFVYKSANLPEDEKSERLRQQEQHLLTVQQERYLYNDMVRRVKDVCHQLGIGELTASTPYSRQIEMHYSFDYAQQVHLPSDPLQLWPTYFLVLRKVGLFGPSNLEGVKCSDFLSSLCTSVRHRKDEMSLSVVKQVQFLLVFGVFTETLLVVFTFTEFSICPETARAV